MLVTMVWLAGRYEASQVQDKLERDTVGAVSEIRSALARNMQDLQALNAGDVALEDWRVRAAELLQVRREIVRVEWRNAAMRLVAHAETPYRGEYWSDNFREESETHAVAACSNARRTNAATYSPSYFQLLGEGLGMELMEACQPLQHQGHFVGYVVATYSLPNILSSQVSKNLTRNQEVSFTEPDGTRLALVGAAWRGTRVFSAQQLLDLPGHTLVLRMDSWHRAPSVFPNVLTALVTAMSIALVSVLVVLVRDNRRRLRAERDLGDALAFRKAMEDSLITGLRARDLQGRISYVNPAFCAMVGFSSEELLGLDIAPYWPPELAQEYRQRQGRRLSGAIPTAREGHESVFMRKDGTRFPVLIFEAPLINAQGQHTGWMSAFIDISEQRRIEEISRASQERLQATARLATVGEMASLLSHELTQPLMAIASYASGSLHLLEGSGNTPVAQLTGEQAREQLQELVAVMRKIGFQADRAGRVIKSVRDFVRRRDQSREAVFPQELLDAVLPLVRMQARKLGVDVETYVAPGLPPVWCDVTMVEQVLLNLTRNGMQAMEAAQIVERRLEVRVQAPEAGQPADRLVFSVSDWGTGIPDEVAEQLFGAFFTTRPEGMGLGLSLCRTVVEQHGGQLQHRQHQPRGTVFTFTLPVAVPQ
ncbi:two-component system sensor histidine kinase NtrB [Comamonas terrigena]|uniref:two-component system sensor histidine kinase NtrB n=1 Tax=Comamonas terrigena TaxID=32013 RepID=UPI002355421D|nr:ATP-binding protein [Comamonas terrigena]MDH0048649.1 PAS domain S-box protein [Comamonas terrigena]MDH0511629.1 PAS domain S-box protein [Comamonas terrigena]MDH1090913.1 PAS domain S-box protein [Comamonas terrigena]MDH1291664.1 PAS domain S-box protein [Comamonas terrigena]MDH1502222.1 PAS domain S-box protein [Comamonas terrigena]